VNIKTIRPYRRPPNYSSIVSSLITHWSKTVLLALGIALCFQVQADKLFDDANGSNFWRNSTNIDTINNQFSAYNINVQKGKLIWSFVPKTATATAEITFLRAIPEFTTLQLRMRNKGADCRFRLQCQSADLIRWTTGVKSLTAGQTQDNIFSFDRNDFSICQEWSIHGVERLSCPLDFLKIRVESLQPNRQYSIEISQIETNLKKFELVQVTPPSLPSKLSPQDCISIPEFSAELPPDTTIAYAELQLFSQDHVVAATPVKSRIKDHRCLFAPTSLEIPKYIFSGKYALRLKLNAICKGTSALSVYPLKNYDLIQRQTDSSLNNSRVQQYNGVPTLFIDDKPHRAMAYASYATFDKNFYNFSNAGIDLFTISGTPTDSTHSFAREVWKENGEFDYRQFDERVMMVLRHNPDARIFPRLNLHIPLWWAQKYPDEVMKIQKADGKLEDYIDWDDSGGKPAPSWASEQWRRDTLAALQKFIRHIESSPYADHIAGYHIASGSTDEWFWSDNNLPGWWDYSPANLKGFRRYLKVKYSTVEALRTAWRNPNVTFDNAVIPGLDQRRNTQTGNSFRNPETERNCIDFYDYNAWNVTDTIAGFAKALKEMTGRRKTIGVFYGYLYELGGGARQVNAGHTNLRAILENPDIDFICSPASYSYRKYGGQGTPLFMSLIDSVKAHGKLWFDENDIRTSLAFRADAWGMTSAGLDGDRWQQRKELAYCMVNGTGQWWFTVAFNRYDNPVLLHEIRMLADLAGEATHLDRTGNSPFAMVVDDASLHYLKPGDNIGAEQLRRCLPAMSRAGNQLQHYLLSDIKLLANKKVIVFANAFAPTETIRKEVDALKNSNRVLVFFNGSGLFKNGKQDLDAAAKFTGITLKCSSTTIGGNFTMEKEGPLTRNIAGKSLGNPANAISPGICPDDPQMTVIARDTHGTPVVAMKRYSDWTAVYCVLPQLPPQFWRNLLELGNVHRYINTPDMVWINRSMLAICVDQPGVRVISLPEKRKVRNMFSGAIVSAEPCQKFEWNFSSNETALFQLE